IVLTAFIDETWRVIQLELTPAGIGDMKIIGNAPANASAPSLWIESSEKALVAWVSLDNNLVSQQIIASTQVLASENQTERLFSIPTLTVRRAINNLHYFPLGILWLLLPLAFLVTRWSAQYKFL